MKRWSSERKFSYKNTIGMRQNNYYLQAVDKLDNYEIKTRQLFQRAQIIRSDYGLSLGYDQQNYSTRVPPFLYYNHQNHPEQSIRHTCRSLKSVGGFNKFDIRK